MRPSRAHLLGNFLVVVDVHCCASELGAGEVHAVAGHLPPVDLAGVLVELVLLDHLVDDLVAEHVVALLLQLVQETGGVVLRRLALALLAPVDLHVALVFGHQLGDLAAAVGLGRQLRPPFELLPRVVELVLLQHLLVTRKHRKNIINNLVQSSPTASLSLLTAKAMDIL